MKQTLVSLINNPNISSSVRDFHIAELKSLEKELEDLEYEIRLLQRAQELDNNFKISAELKRLKTVNEDVEKDINRTCNPILPQLLREHQAKIKKS
jgi:hypothetical protein